MAHLHKAGAPSIDVEGGAGAPLRRRQLARDSPVLPEESPITPPTPYFSPDPRLTGPAVVSIRRVDSPEINHFSTLPPSPPRSTAALPSTKSSPPIHTATRPTWISPSTPNNGQLPTPPSSAPGSALIGGAFRMALSTGVTVLRDEAGQLESESGSEASEYISISRDETVVPVAGSRDGAGGGSVNLLAINDSPSRVKRRPSLILTKAPGEDGSQLAGEAPLPSPRLRRQYHADAISPNLSSHSLSPANSPTMPSLAWPSGLLSPNPGLPISSPTLSSAPMAREPSSPRLGAFTDEIGRMAQGLVRRSSTSSLNADLPTSIKHHPVSTSPSIPPLPSPTLSAGSLSPLLGSGPTRRGSFAAQSREKDREQEKVAEMKEREQRARKASHNRMFSWAVRPGDAVATKARRSGGKGASKLTFRLIMFVGLAATLYLLRAWMTRPRAPMILSKPLHPDLHPVLRRRHRNVPRENVENGVLFIHPDVVNRPPPAVRPPTLTRTPWLWVKSKVVSPPPPPIFDPNDAYHPDLVLHAARRKAGASSAAAALTASETTESAAPHHTFVPARHVQYTEHHPLPPPPVHSDAPERDTLILYRILGNDLPPRHTPGQTLRNLKFLLSHESDFSMLPHVGPHLVHHAHAYGSGHLDRDMHSEEGGLRVDKYFVLNRIADPKTVNAILSLLKSYSVPNSRILIIPFDWEEYERQDFRWDGGVTDLAGWGIGPLHLANQPSAAAPTPEVWLPGADSQASLDELAAKKKRADTLSRLRALDFTYHDKNLYAMNNNGGRNFALKHGRSLPHARWILPLDGNSFFTPAAMYSIVRTLSIAGEGAHASRYLIMPMARLLDNDAVLANNSILQIPKHIHNHGLSAEEEAEDHLRPEGAPETPEEPQIGFRYDSTETFQEAMRYGRRSKLELLWRLGAIPYARGLDRRTLPWEVSDREHVTADTWGTIPGVDGGDRNTPVHQSFVEPGTETFTGPKDPERMSLAFCQAGWVYRLFSGDQRQEFHNSEAVALRNTNRIKGIVAFIEALDEKVARGQAECGNINGACGFSPANLWGFNTEAVERLRQRFKFGLEDTVTKVNRFEERIYDVHAQVSKRFTLPHELAVVDPQEAATNATLLAMAAYITGNSSYSTLSADLITARFVRQVPMFYRANALREQHLKKKDIEQPAVYEFDGVGYGFPPPLTGELAKGVTWGATADRHVQGASLPSLPFNALKFDPSLLLDAVRLLSSSNAPKSDLSHPESQKTMQSIFVSHLSYLLFNPVAIHFSLHPPSPTEGAHFDAKVAALAAFLDDPRLFIRVANRARLRLSDDLHEAGLYFDSEELREVHWRLIQGMSRTKLVPFSLVADEMRDERYGLQAWGETSPFHLLNIE